MSIEKINAAIQKVKQMRYTPAGSSDTTSSVKQAKAVFEEARKKLAEINSDIFLSAQGKDHKAREVKTRAAIEIAKIVRSFEDIKAKELDAAEKMAIDIITKPAAKPAQADIDMFEREYNDLKTQLIVFGGKFSAQKMLEFISKVERPYFAERIRSEFAEFGAKLTSNLSDSEVRTAYEKLKRTADQSEKTIAEQKLEEIRRLKEAPAVDTLTISLGIKLTLGEEYMRALEDPEAFLRTAGE